jgi:cell division protein FtsW
MRENKPDYILLFVIVILLVLGIVVLASISATVSQPKSGLLSNFLFHQIITGLLPGLILGFAAFKIRLGFLKKWIPVLLLFNLAFMILVFAPVVGVSAGGASRWFSIGPLFFQPSEFLKLSFILYLAAWLSGRVDDCPRQSRNLKRLSNIKKTAQSFNFNQTALLPFLMIISFTALLLILQPDVSTLGIILLAAVIMYFLSGTPVWHSIVIISLGAAALAFLIKTAPYRLNRLLVFLNPGLEPMRIGYQIKQSLIAIGSGGILGLGLGMSVQKTGFLPQPMSDSIFAVFAEETGFVGSLILVSLFIIFIWRAFSLASMDRDKFSFLVTCGIGSWITIQAFVNIGSMTGILPLTGIPLPFISYGGSHIVAELIGAGILLNISKQ